MIRFFAIAATLLLCATLMVSCGKRYVGRQVNTNSPYWCHVESFPKSCTIGQAGDTAFFTARITKGETEGSFVVEGVADFSKGNLKYFGNISDTGTRVSILIAKDGVIIANHAFRLRMLGTIQEVPFKVSFECPDGFDAFTFIGEVHMRG